MRVQFGSLIMGNRSHPIQRGTTAVLTLHGDKYVAMDAAGTSAVHNKKALDRESARLQHGRIGGKWSELHSLASDSASSEVGENLQ